MKRVFIFVMMIVSACAHPQPPSTPASPPQTSPEAPPSPPEGQGVEPGSKGGPAAEMPLHREPGEAPRVEQLADEPILTTGHGGFFDRNGQQIPITLAFIEQAQLYYRNQIALSLRGSDKEAFAAYERDLNANLEARGQDRLLLRQEALEWLVDALPAGPYQQRVVPKLRALQHVLTLVVPEKADLKPVEKREVFTPREDVRKRIDTMGNDRRKKAAPRRLATSNSGQAYINECAAAGVPIPPAINVMDPNGTAGWKSQGFIDQSLQFIVGTPAELRSWKSSAPEGMCYALPRYTDNTRATVMLDGVICIGKQSSNVCFWDNQMSGVGFNFPAGAQIPIGVPTGPGGRYQAGGAELEFGSGGVCTDCHAGEDPYIIHPEADLDPTGGVKRWKSLKLAPDSLPSRGVNRYVPHVGASWPQNALSHAGATLPAQCAGCHTKTGTGGRFPHLSNQIRAGYCDTVLAQAITDTMPPSSPGTAAADANNFKNMFCNGPPDASASDAGDPHLTTLSGIHYDFQSAGEFTLLRNLDTAFEIQVRQTPVLTSFVPGVSPYTGLASCVSVNTAIALRIGEHRVSYESVGEAFAHGEELRFFVDGKPVQSAQAIDIDGAKVSTSDKAGTVEIQLVSDQTRVIINPVFWTSENVWYLDVTVHGTTAREGVMGPVLPGEWLPRPSNGKSLGSMPGNLIDRHTVLNKRFANSWRVTPSRSLFTYPAGFGTDAFTDRNWPPPPGKGCASTTVRGVPRVKEPRPDLGQVLCQGIRDEDIFGDCVFDVAVMGGDKAVADAHRTAEKLRKP